MQSALSQTVLAFQETLEAAEHRAQLAIRAGVHFVVSGSFKSTALYLLAFDPVQSTLKVTSTVGAFGPHQYLATNHNRDRLYATTWASPPILSSWAVEYHQGQDAVSSDPAIVQQPPTLRHLNNADIFATSSYVSVSGQTIYSAGGPTAELHRIAQDGGFGEKTQQLQYVTDDEMKTTDRSRKALRVGSHGFDVTADGKGFVPHLGRNSIFMYETDRLGSEGHMHLLAEISSPRPHDGPRHVWPSSDGKLLYAITEHSKLSAIHYLPVRGADRALLLPANFVDVYEIHSKTLKHIQSGRVVPPNLDAHDYRGNTLRLSRDGKFLFASTRGGAKGAKGFVTAFELDATGRLASTEAVHYHETPTSCGIAGAIEPAFWKGSEGTASQDYVLHVDEEAGYVRVLGWSSALKRFKEVASTQLPDGATASHAIWLS